jgi:Family of unknown function (DUF6350)
LLLAAGVTSVVLTYLFVVLVATVAMLTAGGGLVVRTVLTTAIPLWLAAHQVPLVVAGAPLGVLPLLPTAAVIWLAAGVASRLASRLGGRPREDAPAVVASLTGAHASAAVLATALPQSPVQASPWAAVLGGGVVAVVGASAGVLRRMGVPARWRQAPGWVRGGVDASRLGSAWLLTAAALMLLAAFVVSLNDVHERLEASAPAPRSAVGLTVLSLCYLPNTLVAAVSWMAGPGLSIGPAGASPLLVTPGMLPPIPLMAAMPTGRPPAWTAVVFALPTLAGLLVGFRCRQVASDPVRRLYAVGVAAAVVASGFAIAAAVVSGHLAKGPFDPVELPALQLGAALAAWIGVPGAVTVLSPDLPRLPRTRRDGSGETSTRATGRTRTALTTLPATESGGLSEHCRPTAPENASRARGGPATDSGSEQAEAADDDEDNQ